MSDVKVGVLLKGGEGRDAIHIAIAPVTAGEALNPGERCVLHGSGFVVRTHGTGIGIVDPFLGTTVRPGERFYLWLHPYTITSLRHEWVHPSFPAEAAAPVAADDRARSERWLRDLAERINQTYADLMAAAALRIRQRAKGVDWPDYLTGGSEMEGESTPPEFWHHYATVTGEAVPAEFLTEGENFFSCAC